MVFAFFVLLFKILTNIKTNSAKTNIIAKSAFILGVILRLTMEYIKTGRVWKELLVVKYATVKSSKDMENDMIRAQTTEGAIVGSVILKNVILGEHPRSKAASNIFGSILFIFGRIVKTTYGILMVICAIKTVKKLKSPWNMFKTNRINNIKEIPIITSELIIGM